jgi:hypothetical protein
MDIKLQICGDLGLDIVDIITILMIIQRKVRFSNKPNKYFIIRQDQPLLYSDYFLFLLSLIFFLQLLILLTSIS